MTDKDTETTPAPRAYTEAVAALFGVLKLERGWDSYDAERITNAAGMQALRILTNGIDEASATPAIIPVADGGIQVEWHHKSRDVEICIGPQGETRWFVTKKDGEVVLDLPFCEDWGLVKYMAAKDGLGNK